MAYVVAFNGGRDAYQVPLALYEGDALAGLVTDLYVPDALARRSHDPSSLFARRHAPGLPSRLVVSTPRAIALDAARRLGLLGDHRAFAQIDAALSRRAVAVATARRADLLLYSQYAHEAFADPRAAQKRRVLFVFHPHPEAVARILRDDFERHPHCAWSLAHEAETAGPTTRARDARDEWRSAHLVICASSFTRRTLIDAGCRDEIIRVVPYGVDVGAYPERARSGERYRVLFVGQGVQRKGLHHLLVAWSRLRLTRAELTVVATPLDPGIASLAPADVRWLSRLSAPALKEELTRADVLVLPSLVEGFGLVYLEGLAAGCFCVGTTSSGLPDLGCPSWAAAVVAPGSSLEIERALESAWGRWRAGGLEAGRIREFAQTLAWARFRERLRGALGPVAGAG